MQKSHEERRKAKEARRAEQAANVAKKKAGNGADSDGGEEDPNEDLDVEGLSDEDPEEVLERILNRKPVHLQEDEAEFEFEDAGLGGVDTDEVNQEGENDWDEDVDAEEVSSEGEESSEVDGPAVKRRS